MGKMMIRNLSKSLRVPHSGCLENTALVSKTLPRLALKFKHREMQTQHDRKIAAMQMNFAKFTQRWVPKRKKPSSIYHLASAYFFVP
jgi:hypothetical protein